MANNKFRYKRYVLIGFSVFLFIQLFSLMGCAPTAPQVGEVSADQPAARPTGLPWGGVGTKIGFVRSDVIIQRYPNYQDADRVLREENRKWLNEAETLEKEIIRLESEMEELSLILSEERRKQLSDEIVKKRRELQKFRNDTWYSENSTYLKRRRELMDPIDARVNDAIWKVAEMQGLDMVFDSIAGNIVYTRAGLDITEIVLEELMR